ncbi:MAG TPA: protein kinase [Thermoanaerobaculia bacterium]|nr:protein kinase [Thermoanaerobaculia bacterium]
MSMRDQPFQRFHDVDPLLERALELPLGARAAYLERTCGRDPELRLQVERLLQASESGDLRAALDRSLAEQLGSQLATALVGEGEGGLAPGHRLGHYRVVEQIGAGGMGEVYRARDLRLGREVAIKLLPSELASDPERLRRLEREARMLAALNHPNIAAVYGLEDDNDRRFIVLELVPGPTLAELLRAAPLPADQALEAALQIADALAAAHRAGVIHRDLKPANVKRTPEGRIKLLDFGLAKAAPGAESEVDLLDTLADPTTAVGRILGTGPYMSPEQWRGKPVDSRSDLWAFGCVVYEMLTGRLAFGGETHTDVCAAVLTGEPDWGALPGRLPPALEPLLRGCLQQDPELRLHDAGAARLEIEQMLGVGRPGDTVGGDRSVRVAGRGRRWAVLVAAAAALAVVALTWLLAGPFGAAPGGGDRSARSSAGEADITRTMIAVLPFENLGDPADGYFTDGIAEEIRSQLARLEGLGVISRSSTAQYRKGRPPMGRIGEELGVEYVLDGTVRWQPSPDGPSRVRVTPQLVRVAEDTQVWTESYDATVADIFRVQSDVARRVVESLGIAGVGDTFVPERPPTENLEAWQTYLRANDYLHRGLDLQSEHELRIAVEMYEQVVSLDPRFALAHARLGEAHARLYSWSFDRGEDRLRGAREAAATALELQPGETEAHFVQGLVHLAENDFGRAVDELQTVLRARPSHAAAHDALSHAQSDLGDWKSAARSAERAVELMPSSPWIACWAGGTHTGAGQYQDSIRLHERAIRLAPDRTCHYYCEVEVLLMMDGETAGARRFLEAIPRMVDLEMPPPVAYYWVMVEMMDGRYEQALARLDSNPAPAYGSPWYFLPKAQLRAQIRGLLGEPDLARESYEEALALALARLERTPRDPRVHGALGIAYAGLGRRADALREGELGLRLIGDSRGDPYNFRLKDLAQIHVLLGENERALDQLARLVATSGFFTPAYLALDPTFAPLRDEPRFRALAGPTGALRSRDGVGAAGGS